MNDTAPPRHTYRTGLILVAVLVVLGLSVILINQIMTDRGLLPLRPPATAVPASIDGQPLLVTFTELNNNPYDFLNRRIRVNGNLARLAPPDCLPYSGPIIRWALVADDLQMDATGYEALIRLVPAGLPMTVEGVWRLYSGPLGCGKGPAPGTAWFLEVERILQPNPFPPVTITPGMGSPAFPAGTATPTFIPTVTPGGFVFTPTPTAAASVQTTGTATPTGTADGTAVTITATPSATPTGTLSGTPTITPSPSATLPPGAPTQTPTQTPTPTRTPAPGTIQPTPTTAPGFITSTPNPSPPPGYPGITPTPTISGGYP